MTFSDDNQKSLISPEYEHFSSRMYIVLRCFVEEWGKLSYGLPSGVQLTDQKSVSSCLWPWAGTGRPLNHPIMTHCHCHCLHTDESPLLTMTVEHNEHKDYGLRGAWYGEKEHPLGTVIMAVSHTNICLHCGYFYWDSNPEIQSIKDAELQPQSEESRKLAEWVKSTEIIHINLYTRA